MTSITEERSIPLAEQAEKQLIELIAQNKWKVGDKIPNEFILAEQLKVSRSTIREAIKLLISRNVLEIRRGAGTFISDKHGIVDDPLGLSLINDRSNLALDLLAVRFMLEPEIAALAAKNATTEEIAALKLQCNKVEQKIKVGENHLPDDVKLHTMIAHCSQNQVVEKLVPVINSSVTVFGNVTYRKLKQETIATHQQIVDAIERHDQEGAKYAMYMHLTYNRQLILRIMDESNIEE